MNQKNTNFFIIKSISLFGEWYDFSESNYINNSTNVIVTCPIHGSFEITPGNFYTQGCSKCKKHKRTIKLIGKANKKHNYKFDYSKIKIGAHRGEEVIIGCPVHGDVIYTLGQHLTTDSGCPLCSPTRKYTETEIIKMANEIHLNKYTYPSPLNYKNVDTKINIMCPKHGIFPQTPWNHIKEHQGCPSCTNYVGEILISRYLNEYSVIFEVQKRFKDCRNKKPLPFDFYIPDKNLLIEYDGRQHFKPIDIFGGENYLKIIQNHDSIKNEYCKEKEIQLERITYKEDILKRLKEIL